ncbi:MAG: type transport system permease protein [Sphaerochaeta sp.]|jgi:ABC-type transport system involved in multi-copper enzyme maturation permease subunit|uniref:ABC-2 transporter permease n=1 Tax=Sphaerochaeta halotolerans TaxID=2293840 RepID=A0A372MGR0_9SPIR|nr:ABC-2 transporter permease [Sphaerochaeta halotolerans]MBG0766207.1 ABC-2 transporter permease [Spirochaetaceae bacterium]MDK2859192.1 type transport system permease protein [Sphaerochaeta sp.]MDN5333433.1 type transport system permease protein [Sphaerochaeta sp.]RFU94633.1 ABC-2 transporter permease [Sphaerochaeta halotolerans]
MNTIITLMLKDWYVLKSKSGLTLFLIVFFAVFAGLQGGFLYTAMCTMMMVMLTITTFAYDQSDGWEAYVSALPVSRKAVVQSKYLFGLLTVLVSVVLVLVFSLVFRGFQVDVLLNALQLQISIGIFFLSLNYPLILKFGFEKSRVWYILVTFLIVGAGSALSSIASQTGFQNNSLVSVFMVILVVALLVVSYFISLGILKRKEFIEI